MPPVVAAGAALLTEIGAAAAGIIEGISIGSIALGLVESAALTSLSATLGRARGYDIHHPAEQ